MALKDIWVDKTEGVDDVLAEDINTIANAVITNENAIAEQGNSKQDKLTEEQLTNIADVPNKQDKLTEEQLTNIASVPDKADKATTLDGYGITDAYTKAEVEAKDTALKEAIETLKEKSIPHTTVSEYPVSVSDHLEGESVIDYRVYGNSIQDGTPTPDNPVEIQSVGDLVTDEASEYYGKYDIPIIATEYKGSSITHIYLDEPLRKIGNFADYINFKNQKGIRNIKEFTLNGSESWSLQGINENGIISFVYSLSNETASLTTSVPALSTHFTYRADGLSVATEPGFFVQRGSLSTRLFIRMLNEKIADIAAFKKWLSENNLTVYCPMATPTEESISLPNLTVPNSEVMNVSLSTAIQPSMIDLTYYQNINKVINNLTNAILAQGGNV